MNTQWKPVNKDDDEYNDDGWGPYYPERKKKLGGGE